MISYNLADNLKPIGISNHIRVFIWRFVTSHDGCHTYPASAAPVVLRIDNESIQV